MSPLEGDSLPVERISGDECQEFCDRLSRYTGRIYRLPSEIEWEYACRARTTTPFHYGPTLISTLANYDGNRTYGQAPQGIDRQTTTPVGSFPPNGFGLYDMHGNVWERCSETGDRQSNPGSDYLGLSRTPYSKHPIRGGCWLNTPQRCRSGSRLWFRSDLKFSGLGLRIVCSSFPSANQSVDVRG